MKILQMLPDFEDGGVERHVLWLSNELARIGNSVAVISNSGKLERDLKDVKHISMDIAAKKPALIVKNAFKIAGLIKQGNYDVIHAHSRVPAFSAWIASALTKTPWIYTAHSCYSKNLGLTPLRHAGAVICVSETVLHHLVDYLPKKKIVIYNALPSSTYRWKGPDDGDFCFLYVGRLTKIKGIDIIIEACKSLKDINGWKLDIAGDGPMRQELNEKVKQSGLEDRVSFLGFRNDVLSLIGSCSCLLFPSLQEGFGLTLMEGAKMGAPFLASDIPAVRELMPSAKLLKPGSVDDWQNAMTEVLCSRQRPNVDILAAGEYDIKKMTEDVLDVYKSVILQ